MNRRNPSSSERGSTLQLRSSGESEEEAGAIMDCTGTGRVRMSLARGPLLTELTLAVTSLPSYSTLVHVLVVQAGPFTRRTR